MKSWIPGLISAAPVFATLRLAIIFLVQGFIWGQGSPPSYDFVTNGIREAHVDTANGMARLIINGQPVPPLLFMYQENFPKQIQFLAPQVQDATANGIHLFMINITTNWPWDNGGTAPLDFTATDHLLDNVIKADPQAALVLIVGVWPGGCCWQTGWKPPVEPTAADQILYPDGSTTDPYHSSLASDIYFNGFLTSVPHLLQRYENSSYATHILGYIIAWQGTGEWYPVEIWRGPDYSSVNTQAFEKWLQNKYGTDAALSAAWGRSTTIADAQVPAPQAGRFPMHSVIGSNSPIEAFYRIPQEQDWVDYSAYVSDLTSQRILDAAKLIRTTTGGKRLIGVHYGYLIELMGSFNGHLRVDRLLASPYIDFFGGAITPYDRLAGGAGGVGATVDSFIAHGKLWFNENDLYTYLSAESIFPPVGSSNPPTANLTETVDVLDRELASVLSHRAGTWWMDISENGAFDEPAIWTPMSQQGIPLFNQLYANPQPYQTDLALIIDPNSILYQKSDIDVMIAQRAMLRYALAKTGVASGIYTLDDFLDGTAPRSKVYVFANTFYLTDDQISKIQSRLNTEGATAIWQYAPGFLGPSGADVSRASTLTGIQLSQSDGYGYTTGSGPMAGYGWGFTNQNVLSPRLVVTDPNAEVLGRYQSDNLVSSARKKVGNFESVFIGEFALGAFTGSAFGSSPPPDVLRALLQTTGVHIWSTAGDVVFTDGNLLVVHAAAAGPDSISLSAGINAVPLNASSGQTPSTGTLNITFSRTGETQWLRLFKPQASSVSAAAYTPSLAPESIASAFGSDLATSAMQVTTLPLPTTFNGTTVKVMDSAGVERLAPLFYVSLTQVNYEIPAGTATGPALVTITSGDGAVSSGNVNITSVAPALFSANADGRGPAAGLAIHVKPDGSQTYESLAAFDPSSHQEVSAPIDLGPADERVFLSLAGSGIRGRSALANVTATIGSSAVPVTYAGAQATYVGLDQVNLGPLPRSLIGAGVVNISLTVDGQKANTLQMQTK